MARTAAPRGPLTPAGFASEASEGRWYAPPHLQLLNAKLLDLAARRTTRLIVQIAPRHGKSQMISHYFPAWWLGTFPDDRVMLTSYEADFAATWGRKAQDALAAHGKRLFGVEVDPGATAASAWGVRGRAGGMNTAGVGGAITGRGANILICDDPVKNAEEAASQARRDAVWDWFTSTAYTRIEPGGVCAILMARWHEDDLVGRLLAQMGAGGERWDVLNLPALAEEGDPLGRPVGAALWPERYDVAALESIRRTIGGYFFDALYMGHPRPKDGGVFKRSWFDDKVTTVEPERMGTTYCRYWDRAASHLKGDYSVGVLMARTRDGAYHVLDVRRGQWSSHERDKKIREAAAADRERYGRVRQRAEQEPGSSGKDAAVAFLKLLDGHDASVDRVTGDKESRARPLASACEAGSVRLLKAPWNDSFLDELCSFPRGKFDDQVDSASGSYNCLSNAFVSKLAPDPTRRYRGRTA